jgi:hypothetical protein
MTPHVPKPQRGSSVRNGFFRKDEFRYDPDQDVYICPAGTTLSPHHQSKLGDLKKIDYSKRRAPPVLFGQGATNRRRVSRLENEAVLDRMDARLKARPQILDRLKQYGRTLKTPFLALLLTTLKRAISCGLVRATMGGSSTVAAQSEESFLNISAKQFFATILTIPCSSWGIS